MTIIPNITISTLSTTITIITIIGDIVPVLLQAPRVIQAPVVAGEDVLGAAADERACAADSG